MAKPRTPIIISGGSITVHSLPVANSGSWDDFKVDHQSYVDIPVGDASELRFFPTAAVDNAPDGALALSGNWQVIVYWKDDATRTHTVTVQGQPHNKINVRSSHCFSEVPHQPLEGYEGRSFCKEDMPDPAAFDIGEEIVVSGLVDQNGQPLPNRIFVCADSTCQVRIGKPLD